MKVILTEAQPIKGKDYEAGDTAIVNKALGERMISDGAANRMIGEPQNRVTSTKPQYVGHKKIFNGTDGKRYIRKGNCVVEVKD